MDNNEGLRGERVTMIVKTSKYIGIVLAIDTIKGILLDDFLLFYY